MSILIRTDYKMYEISQAIYINPSLGAYQACPFTVSMLTLFIVIKVD